MTPEPGQVWWYGWSDDHQVRVHAVNGDVVTYENSLYDGSVFYDAMTINQFLEEHTPERQAEPYTLPQDVKHLHRNISVHVLDEVTRQNEKWGSHRRCPDISSDDRNDYVDAEWLAKAVVNNRTAAGTLAWADILTEEVMEAYAAKNDTDRQAELIQVAAVVQSWLEDIMTRAEGS